MAREPSLNLPNPWAAVGRDTEAGRALFALYNGYNHARSRGNDYSQINKLKTLRYIATHGLPEFPVLPPPPPKKLEVKVPHFAHNNGYNPHEFHPIDFIPRRRRASKILKQIRDDSYEVELPPMPKGPLLDDAEKARLQEVFYWSNRHVGPDPPVGEPVRRVPKKGSIEEQEIMLNTIAGEIEDREAFLNEMEAYGKGEQYRSQIMFEIQQRVGQMKLLHENISKIEKKENENCQSVQVKAPLISSYTAPSKNLYARGQGRNANTMSLRFNPSIGLMQELQEDPRFWERSSHSTRLNGGPTQTLGCQHETLRTRPVANPWRIDTPDSSTPNVIRTVACCATTPSDVNAASIAEPQPPRNLPSNSCWNSKKVVSKIGHSVGKSPDYVAAKSPLTSSSSDPCGRFANIGHPQMHSSNSEYTISATSANYPSRSTPGNGESSPMRDCSPLESPHNFNEDQDKEYPFPGY